MGGLLAKLPNHKRSRNYLSFLSSTFPSSCTHQTCIVGVVYVACDHTFNVVTICRSYGVLLWEIMTLGRAPYPGVENRELLEQIEEKQLKLTKPKPCPNAM